MIYGLGDTVITKKKHVCGSDAWEVIRYGVDIRIRCKGCGREVMMFKADLDRRVVRVIPADKEKLST